MISFGFFCALFSLQINSGEKGHLAPLRSAWLSPAPPSPWPSGSVVRASPAAWALRGSSSGLGHPSSISRAGVPRGPHSRIRHRNHTVLPGVQSHVGVSFTSSPSAPCSGGPVPILACTPLLHGYCGSGPGQHPGPRGDLRLPGHVHPSIGRVGGSSAREAPSLQGRRWLRTAPVRRVLLHFGRGKHVRPGLATP